MGRGLSRVWQLDEVLFEATTDYQHVVIAKTSQGISLFCDSDRQSTEFSQLVYHEALAVPALLLADRLRRVLIIGSSEGVLSQLVLAAGAEEVDHVDIDADTVRACARYLPYGYTREDLAVAERRAGALRMHYADGWDFLATTSEAGGYDVVIVDLPDEHDEGRRQQNRLYETDYLMRCRSVLNPGGVVAYQSGCATLWRNSTLSRAWQRFQQTFATTVYFGSDEHEWSFLFGRPDHLERPVAAMLAAFPDLRYRPASIDEPALRSRTVPPYRLRHG
ncbi:MAG: spermidine synthase [Pseudonocardiaceae bacterium]|nr:spermidine synthase [Pseudonocardiaceae bacterium]